MCGIMGYFCFGEATPKKEEITEMFTMLETRGRDASGFAFIRDGNLMVHKAATASSEFVKTKQWTEQPVEPMMIFHTRLKTQGETKNNMNNHPLFNKQGWCIVHNGIINNDKEIFSRTKRDAEVDSEAILALLSPKTKSDRIRILFDKIEGSFATAIINKYDPNRLILIKKDNPIELYYNEETDILYFCSERQIMQEAFGLKSTHKRGFNIGEGKYHHYTMENNHALILNKEGVESYKQYYPRPNRWFSCPDRLVVQCPYCLSETTYYDGRVFNRCDVCGMNINEEDFYDV